MYRVFVVGPWLVTFGLERAEPVEELPDGTEAVIAMAKAGDAYGRIVARYIEASQEFGTVLALEMTSLVETFAVFAEAAAQAIEDAEDGG